MSAQRVFGCTLVITCLLLRVAYAQRPGGGHTQRREAAQAVITREQGEAILKELREIHRLLETDPQSTSPQVVADPTKQITQVKMSVLPVWDVIGRDEAPVTIVEFADYQCPFCRRFHIGTFEEIKKRYIDTGQVRFVSRDMPLPFHPGALPAAQAARCAGDQHKFWQMRDALINNSQNLSMESIISYARQQDLDPQSFRACMDSGKFKSSIQQDVADAAALSIPATPSFVIAATANQELEGELIVGAQPTAVFEAAIKRVINRPLASANGERHKSAIIGGGGD